MRSTSTLGRSFRPTHRPVRLAGVFALAAVFFLPAGTARCEIFETDRLKISGDFRARIESDFDSKTAGGEPRQDRTRVRVRARLGLAYKPLSYLTFGMRLRSGSDDSHQSPHITVVDLDGNDTGDSDFNLDRYFLRAEAAGVWGWIGRNSFPFWKQNELFWDDDATPAGIAGGTRANLTDGSITVTAAFFTLPVGLQEFSGNLAAGQIVYKQNFGDLGLTVAGDLYDFDAEPEDPDAPVLLSGNGFRDYRIAKGSVQVALGTWGRRPLTVGVDVLRNLEDYDPDDADPFTADNHDQTDGRVLSAAYGKLGQRGDWLAAYTNARIETFAVDSSYSQDDWLRWGTATQTRSSNFKGHEFRLVYALEETMNLMARFYLVRAITTPEDGKRFRLDYNVRF